MKINEHVAHKLCDEAKIPEKKEADGGYDLYAIWDNPIEIQKPNEVKVLKTGLKMSFPLNEVALFRERGSTGILNLQIRAGVVEGNYRGEYKLILSNGNEYKDIIFINEDIRMMDIIEKMNEIYPLELWEHVCEDDLKIEKDEYGRRILKRKFDHEENGEFKEVAYIYPQEKAVAQMILLNKIDVVWNQISEEEYNKIPSDRGSGKFGSTNK